MADNISEKSSEKIAFYTFGCRLNQAETAVIEQGFKGDRYEVVDYRQNPDLLVVNTCTVTENGDADTRRLVNKAIRNNPEVKIALVGCQAQVQKAQLLELPNVRWVVGNARKMELAEIFAAGSDGTPQLITPTIKKDSFTVPFTGFDKHHTRANLKIQDGCDFFCSFCEIPYARGRARSREYDDILKEARQLSEAGHHELVLTGINIGTYAFQQYTLPDVLDGLEELPELWRIRISSIEPTTIDPRVIHKIADSPKFCNYLHIPIQTGSDAVLSAMNRKYTLKEFCDFLDFCRETIPDVCLGTDVIVGFPGESDAHFEETYKLLSDLDIAYFHVFSYSDRDHARSSKYPANQKVPREKIIERSRQLRELSTRKRQAYYRRFTNTTQRVLFESKKNGLWSGLTDTFIRVKVASDKDLANKLVLVRLEGLEDQHMRGSLL